MALKSYTKKGYTYTESAKGSNKFQNFKAAPTPMGERERPTVSAVRKQSASAKATSAATATPVSTKAFSKGLADRQPIASSASSASTKAFPKGLADRQTQAARPAVARQSTGPVPRPRVQATQNASVSSAPTFPKGKGTPPAPKKSILGSLVDRVTQPPTPMSPETKRTLDKAKSDINAVMGVAAASSIVGKAGLGIINRLSKWERSFMKSTTPRLEPPRVRLEGPKPKSGGNLIEGAHPKQPRLTGPKPKTPKPKLTPRQKAAKKGAKTKKNIKQFLKETGLTPRPKGSTWEF